MIGRECGGYMRGLAGFPRVAAKVLEGYSAVRGFPREVWSKTPRWAPLPKVPELERNPDIKLLKVVCVLSSVESQPESQKGF